MSKTKIRSIALALGVLAVLALAAVAQAEIVQKGDLRVKFEGQLTPHSLPRSTQAPVKVSVSAKITPVGNAELPQLRTMSIAINRFGDINTKGLPVCELDDIQPATTADALAVCRKSLVGEGSFTADVPSRDGRPSPPRASSTPSTASSKASPRSSPTSTGCARRRPRSPWSS